MLSILIIQNCDASEPLLKIPSLDHLIVIRNGKRQCSRVLWSRLYPNARVRKPRTRFQAGCIFQDCGHGYSAACNMHTVESAGYSARSLEVQAAQQARQEGGQNRGGGFSTRYSGQTGGLTGARVTVHTLSRGELSAPTPSSQSFRRAVAREGDKQLKIYSTCFHSKHRPANTDARRILISSPVLWQLYRPWFTFILPPRFPSICCYVRRP